MHEKRAVSFEHEQPGRFGKTSREATRVDDFPAGDEETHDRDSIWPLRTVHDELLRAEVRPTLTSRFERMRILR